MVTMPPMEPGDEGDSGLAIVCHGICHRICLEIRHGMYCREKRGVRRGGFSVKARYGTKRADMSGNAEAPKALQTKRRR